jgi:hypothetical protein
MKGHFRRRCGLAHASSTKKKMSGRGELAPWGGPCGHRQLWPPLHVGFSSARRRPNDTQSATSNSSTQCPVPMAGNAHTPQAAPGPRPRRAVRGPGAWVSQFTKLGRKASERIFFANGAKGGRGPGATPPHPPPHLPSPQSPEPRTQNQNVSAPRPAQNAKHHKQRQLQLHTRGTCLRQERAWRAAWPTNEYPGCLGALGALALAILAILGKLVIGSI